jgi:hypothetical protein
MTQSQDHVPSHRNLLRYLPLLGLLIVLAGGAFAFLRQQPRGPKLLNEPTKAREARPFTTKPDPRFDPLPLEREKHGK